MQINFTGLKNTGYKHDKIHATVKYNGKEYIKEKEYILVDDINTELTDDYNGKDLSEYRKFRDKIYSHPINPNFINIRTIKGELEEDKGLYILVNGAQVEIEDENLPLLSFITKLIRRISQQNNTEFIVNKDYLYNDDAPKSISIDEDIRDDFNKTWGYDRDGYKYHIEDLHEPYNVKQGASKMFERINGKMIEYFC